MTNSSSPNIGKTGSVSCLHCAHLREEVAELRRELSYEVDCQVTAAFRKATGCSPQQAEILALLYRANRRFVRAVVMLDAMGSVSEVTNVARVQISKLRTHLPAGSIETLFGRGYRLTEKGRVFVDSLGVRAAA